MPEPNLPFPANPIPPVTPVSPAPPVPVEIPVPLVTPAPNLPPRRGINLILVLFLAAFFIPLGLVLGTQLKNFPFLTKAPAALPSPSAADLLQQNEIKIGGILPLTGDGAAYGIPIQQTAIMAQKEINDQGGIMGKQIKFIWKDGRCEKNDAQAAGEELVNKEKVDFLIGGACSSEFLNSAPIAQAKKVISFGSSTTSPKISQLGRYVFRTCPSDTLAGKAAAGYAYNKWGAKTAAVIVEDKDYPIGLKEVFTQNFMELGGKVLMSEDFPTGTIDFATVSAKAKSTRADVVYIVPQTPTPGILLVKALKAQGVTSKILTAETLLIRDAVAEQGQILEGVTGIEILFDESRPKAKHFLELYKKEYKLDPTYPGFMAGMYDIIYLIKEAYESGAKNTDEIADWLYGLKKWDGAVGTLQFDSHGDPTMTYSIRQITNFSAPQVDTYVPSP